MEVLSSVLREELERLIELRKYYARELSKLPIGCLIRKRINKRDYYYLNYREKRKQVFKYIGKLKEGEVKELSDKIARRRKLWKLDGKAKKDIVRLRKMLHEKEK
jgi:hypothetical protein